MSPAPSAPGVSPPKTDLAACSMLLLTVMAMFLGKVSHAAERARGRRVSPREANLRAQTWCASEPMDLAAEGKARVPATRWRMRR